MKRFILLLLPLVAHLVSLGTADRPNILFIFSDDHAINAISAYPGGQFDEIAPTPSIDRLADEGMLFTRSYCTNSICGPSRASILTGKHSHMNGFLDNNSSHFDGLQQTFPQLLRDVGYYTAMIGKWHLHSNPVGFDYWEVLPGQGNYYNPDLIQMDNSRKQYMGHCNDIVKDLALEQLKDRKSNSEDPFMMMVQFKAPHRNWSAAERHLRLFEDIAMPEPPTLFDDYANRNDVLKEHAMGIDKHMSWAHDMKFHGDVLFPEHFAAWGSNGEYKRMTDEQKAAWDAVYEPRNQAFIADMEAGKLSHEDVVRWKYQRYIKDYLRTIRSMDESIGEILDYLDETGLADNTIVIYSSDQGFYLGEHGWYDKRWMFEESFTMPFIARWPGVIEPATQSAALIQNIDYAPTFLEICGADIPADMQGTSLVPVFENSGDKPDGWRESLFYKYYGERTHNVAAHEGIRTEDYKLFVFPDSGEYQLFDMEKDPQEMVSVHDDPAYAEVFADLKGQLLELKKQYRAHSALIPAHRLNKDWWQQRHTEKNALAAENKYDLILIGDSITHGWEKGGKTVWDEYYADRNALNLGYSGDHTEHVLWRLNNGELKNQQDARLAVMMIGTNNTGHLEQDPYETAEGIERILSVLRARCPKAKVLLLGVFPRSVSPGDHKRLINVSINQQIAKLADGDRVHFLDIGDAFLTPEGILLPEIMPDALHPKEAGYRIWAEAIEPKLRELGI